MSTEPQFLIWSEEHAAWWMRPRGYSHSIFQAGHFNFQEAMQITSDANAFVEPGEIKEVALFAIILGESFDGSKTRQDAPGSL
jgi:hypothetical protein